MYEAHRSPDSTFRKENTMQLLEFIMNVPLPVIVIVVAVLFVVTIFMSIQYMKAKGLEGIRNDVYQLILKAEHMYNESGQGKQKFEWVIQQSRMLLPRWLQIFVTEEMLKKIVQSWFTGIKDILDDGKINGSQETDQEAE